MASPKGVKVTIAHNDGSNIYSPARFFELRGFMSNESFDVVHSHLGPSFHWSALAFLTLKARYAESKLITTEHAVHNRRMKMPLLRSFERWLYSQHHMILCVSEGGRFLDGLAFHSFRRLLVVPNGIVWKFSTAVNPDAGVLSWARGRTVISMTARFIAEKDHKTAIAP